MDMDNNFDAFDEYVSSFDLVDYMNAYKYKHSYRVMKNSKEIAASLKLSSNDTYLCELIGLLHDIGRFYQMTNYETLVDEESLDHGDYGAKLLFEDGLIKKFDLNEEDYELVKKAIKNHNKFKIEKANKRETLFCNIIRDADKIDILYAYSNPKLLEFDCNNKEEIKEDIKKAFFNHKQVKFDKSRNQNELLIETIALIYDINFDYTKNKILKEKYLEKIYKNIKYKSIFKPYFDEAIKYLKESVK